MLSKISAGGSSRQLLHKRLPAKVLELQNGRTLSGILLDKQLT